MKIIYMALAIFTMVLPASFGMSTTLDNGVEQMNIQQPTE
jgi:hypothetical protein